MGVTDVLAAVILSSGSSDGSGGALVLAGWPEAAGPEAVGDQRERERDIQGEAGVLGLAAEGDVVGRAVEGDVVGPAVEENVVGPAVEGDVVGAGAPVDAVDGVWADVKGVGPERGEVGPEKGELGPGLVRVGDVSSVVPLSDMVGI